jgi:hypothetical protein
MLITNFPLFAVPSLIMFLALSTCRKSKAFPVDKVIRKNLKNSVRATVSYLLVVDMTVEPY